MVGTSVLKGEVFENREARIAHLRARMAKMGVPDSFHAPGVTKDDVVAVSGPLSVLLSGGGLPRRAVTHMNECAALAVEIIAHASSAGDSVAVVGWPELIVTGDTVLVVPDAGVDPLHVVGVLAQNVDLVVFHTARAWSVPPSVARPLGAKLREGTAALVAVGAHLPSPALTLTGEVTGFTGIARGTGRIRSIEVSVRAETKARQARTGSLYIGQQPPEKPTLRVV